MKKILAALLVTLPLAALAQYEPAPPPPDDSSYGSRRNPWYIGFGLGTGGGNVSGQGSSFTLDELNRYFQAWLHADYHRTVHSATGQTPLQRFEASTRFRRHVKLSDVLELFHVQVRRKVDEEFCDVRINNLYFAVDAKLRGDRVIVVYDPFSTLEEVRLKSLHGEFMGLGRRYQRERGAHSQPPRDP